MATPTPRIFRITDNAAYSGVRWITNYITYRQVRGNDEVRLEQELGLSGAYIGLDAQGNADVAAWTTAQARTLAGIFVADPANAATSPDRPVP